MPKPLRAAKTDFPVIYRHGALYRQAAQSAPADNIVSPDCAGQQLLLSGVFLSAPIRQSLL
jgi:hypothetical protein